MSTLLEDVIIAHGGLARWKALTTVQATIVTGGAFWCSPPCGSGSAVTWRKAPHERAAVRQPRHLRASGDLAYKKIFPALQAMMRRGISRGRLLGDAMGGDATLFGVVKAAQARGDFQVLTGRGTRALRVHLSKDVLAGWRPCKQQCSRH